MKRFLKILAILVVLAGAAFLAWWYFFPSKTVNGLNLIPEDAMYILHTQKPVDEWNNLSKSKVWQFLKGHKTFKEISEYADALDEMIQANRTSFSLVGERDLFISAHPIKKNDYDFLFALDLKKAGGIAGLKDALSLTFRQGGYQVESRDYKKSEILEILDPETRDILYLTVVHQFLVCSYTAKLLERSLDQVETAYLANNKNLTDLVSITDDDGLGKLYIHYAFIDDYMNCYMDAPDPMVNDLSKILRFTSAYFDLTDQSVEADGYTNLNDSMESYMKALMLSGKAKCGAASVLSNRTAIMVNFGFNNFPAFKANLMQVYRQDKNKEAEYKTWVNKIERLLKIRVDEHLLGWIGNEVAYAQNRPSKYSESREDDIIIAMHAPDIEKAKEGLGFIHRQIKRRTPAKFKSMEFRNHEINYLEIKGFFRLMFGKLFSKLQKPYYTTLGDYVVFSNSPKTLVGMIMDYEDGLTLQEEESYQRFRKNFQEEASLFCYISGPDMFPLLRKKSNPQTWQDLQKSKKYITSFDHNGFQLISAGDKFKTRLFLQFEEQIEVQGQEEDSLEVIFNSQVQDISGVLDSMDDAARFILEKLQKGKYFRPYPNSDQNEIEAETVDGALQGDYKEFYPDGTLRVDGRYRKGRKSGTWKYYDESGSLTEKVKYKF